MHIRYCVIGSAAIAVCLFFARTGGAVSGPTPATAVQNDSGRGALSSSMVKHMSNENKQQDWMQRKEALLQYSAWVGPRNEQALKDFKGGDDPASLAMEQGKAAFVFHVLRKLAGEQTFNRAAGLLTAAGPAPSSSWDDVKKTFEKELGRDLGWFFKQWVERKGLPDLRLENAAVRRFGSRFEVSFELAQKGEVYTLDVPVLISFLGGVGDKSDNVKIETEKKHVTLYVDEEPSFLSLDPDYELPRRLSGDETPPLLATLLGEEKPIVVLPTAGREAYATVIEALKKRGAEERAATSIKEPDLKNSSFAVMGGDNPFLSRLFGAVKPQNAGFSAEVKKNPWNPEKVVVIFQAKSAPAQNALVTKLLQYEKYSEVSFDEQGSEIATRAAASERGMRVELREQAAAIDLSARRTVSDALDRARNKKIVYVGETHDRFAHHSVQLQVIKELFGKNPNLAIGMEMFQRPFQKPLDEYIAGTIDEREFLKKTEYFKRWSLDYNLYKPILDFARERKIPVIALNLREELSGKVSKGGIDSLSTEEVKELPLQLDFSDDDYRERLKIIFGQHKARKEQGFDHFYQAQVLWDETMAQSIDEYLKKNPGRLMVVIAGSGHLAYGSGIPKRAYRRNGLPYFIMLNDGDVDRDIADYLVLPQALDGAAAPRIMAVLNDQNSRVSIIDLPEDSVSRKAGVKVGDVILALDGKKMEKIEDIKLELFFKKKDDTIKLTVLRKRFLLPDKELEIAVKL